ncbi:MAG: hypothetical protein U1E65_28645 [Myxococcota bacterium]
MNEIDPKILAILEDAPIDLRAAQQDRVDHSAPPVPRALPGAEPVPTDSRAMKASPAARFLLSADPKPAAPEEPEDEG